MRPTHFQLGFRLVSTRVSAGVNLHRPTMDFLTAAAKRARSSPDSGTGRADSTPASDSSECTAACQGPVHDARRITSQFVERHLCLGMV
jgi:hypothetical protein